VCAPPDETTTAGGRGRFSPTFPQILDSACFSPFSAPAASAISGGKHIKKLMKKIALWLLISHTTTLRKRAGESVDFLRKQRNLRCVKACGNREENWRISGGSVAEKLLPDAAMLSGLS
jgi:hypothetical protein